MGFVWSITEPSTCSLKDDTVNLGKAAYSTHVLLLMEIQVEGIQRKIFSVVFLIHNNRDSLSFNCSDQHNHLMNLGRNKHRPLICTLEKPYSQMVHLPCRAQESKSVPMSLGYL